MTSQHTAVHNFKNRLKSMAAVKYEFSIGALKAFYSIVCADILLVCNSRNAVSENRKKSVPKVSSKCPFKTPWWQYKIYENWVLIFEWIFLQLILI